MGEANDAIRLKKVNHLTYSVTDKERALRFWEDVLGVKRIPSQVSAEHIIWLQVPSGTMVHLIEDAGAPSVPSHHGAFEVDDIEATAKAIQAKGVETSDVQTRNDGQQALFITDPDGNRIEICTRSGFPGLV